MNQDNSKRKDNNASAKILLSVLAVAILVFTVIGISFAAFTYTGVGEKDNTITTSTITMTYNEGTAITIVDATPMSDETGKNLNGTNETFAFTVSASLSGNTAISYEVAAIKKEGSTLSDDDIRLYLTKQVSGSEQEVFGPGPFVPSSSPTALGSPIGSMVLTSGTFTETAMNQYTLRMWLAENATLSADSQSYTVTVNVYAKNA